MSLVARHVWRTPVQSALRLVGVERACDRTRVAVRLAFEVNVFGIDGSYEAGGRDLIAQPGGIGDNPPHCVAAPNRRGVRRWSRVGVAGAGVRGIQVAMS